MLLQGTDYAEDPGAASAQDIESAQTNNGPEPVVILYRSVVPVLRASAKVIKCPQSMGYRTYCTYLIFRLVPAALATAVETKVHAPAGAIVETLHANLVGADSDLEPVGVLVTAFPVALADLRTSCAGIKVAADALCASA